MTGSGASPLAEPAWPCLGYKKLGLGTQNVSRDREDLGWVFERVGIAVRVPVDELQIFSEGLTPVLGCTGQ